MSKVEEILPDDEISFVAKITKDGGIRISIPEDIIRDLKLEKEDYLWVTLTSKKWHEMLKGDDIIKDYRIGKTK